VNVERGGALKGSGVALVGVVNEQLIDRRLFDRRGGCNG
jgi:hypothetical protein